MTTLIDSLSSPAWRQVLLTLAHSLWQGAALALLLAAVLTRIAGNRPQARYFASLASLAALVVSCLVTWSVLDLPPSLARSRPIAAEQSSGSPRPANDTQRIPASSEPSHQASAIEAITTASGSRSLSDGFWRALAPICTALWLVGMTTMLIRMAVLVTGARRLADRPRITDARVLDLVETLRGRLGIRRAIAVVDAATIGPAVLGILRPVLLLPAAIITELSPDCLEAILAHELAHICRHDYLVNLVQMLIEAALFFNPAVWWISRQVRREREACCDALAVGITGRPLTYAEALTAWLERMHSDRFAPAPSPATAGWLGQGRRGGVLDRIRRLVVAGYRPELRGSWSALAAGLAVSMLTLSALWTGTRAGVALAAEILSPAQRLEQLVQDRDALRPTADPGAKATLAGTIRTSDDKPLSGPLNGTVYTKNENGGVNATEWFTAPDFSVRVPWGRTWAALSVKGYAPAVLGPLETKPGQTLDGLDILLGPGFTSYVRLIDEHDTPIIGATVKATLVLDDGGVGAPCDSRSDDQGVIVLEPLGAATYQFDIAAPGFQTLRLGPGKLKPDETITRMLVAAAPTRGVVVSPDGDPIAGAIIRCVASMLGNHSSLDGNQGPVMATTDGEGQFTLDRLDDAMVYAFRVETPDRGWALFPNVQAGESGLRWVVGPHFTVTGRIVGGVSKLTLRRAGPRVDYSQRYKMAAGSGLNFSSEFLATNGEAEVVSVEGEHRFELKNLLPGKLSITAGTRKFDFVIDQPATEVSIDLDETPAALPTRRVVLRFVGTDAGLAPQGQVAISMTKGSPVADQPSTAEIKDGIVEVNAYVPGRIHYAMKNVVGYWFASGVVEVPTGIGPLEHDVPVIAAGGIRGRLLNVQGKPAGGNARVAAVAIEKPPGIAIDPLGAHDVPVEGSGEFFISPLPLGGRYVVLASRGFENAQSEPVRVDAKKPSPTVKVRFSKTCDVVGRVLAPDGQPLADMPVSLVFQGSPGGMSYGPPRPTDRNGRFEFAGLSTGAGEYLAKIKPLRDFQPADVPLPLEGPPIDIQLKPGHVIAGGLLDAATGQPLAGIPLHAIPSRGEPLKLFRYETEEPTTDANGRFRFSTLPEGKFSMSAGCVLTWQSTADELTAHTGESIELRASKPEQK
jgi:beta-lactamase regulating signal transducer with metallopeptidase domain